MHRIKHEGFSTIKLISLRFSFDSLISIYTDRFIPLVLKLQKTWLLQCSDGDAHRLCCNTKNYITKCTGNSEQGEIATNRQIWWENRVHWWPWLDRLQIKMMSGVLIPLVKVEIEMRLEVRAEEKLKAVCRWAEDDCSATCLVFT